MEGHEFDDLVGWALAIRIIAAALAAIVRRRSSRGAGAAVSPIEAGRLYTIHETEDAPPRFALYKPLFRPWTYRVFDVHGQIGRIRKRWDVRGKSSPPT